MAALGRILLYSGLVLSAVGLLLICGERLGLGRLPGDLSWRRKGAEVHFPIMTSLVVSLLLTVLLNLLLRRK